MEKRVVSVEEGTSDVSVWFNSLLLLKRRHRRVMFSCLDGVEKIMTWNEVNNLFGWPTDRPMGSTKLMKFKRDPNTTLLCSSTFWNKITKD